MPPIGLMLRSALLAGPAKSDLRARVSKHVAARPGPPAPFETRARKIDFVESFDPRAPQGEGGSLSRRALLKLSVAAAAFAAAPARVRAAAPEPVPVTPDLVEAAKKEGKVVWYAAMDLPVSERVARGFEAK